MPQEPTSSSGAYDFLNQQPEKKASKIPLPKLPKMAWIILITSFALLFILVVIALVSGGGRSTSSSPYVESLSYAQEITRVSGTVKQMTQDPNTQSLAATTSSVLLSDAAELNNYLKKVGVKVDPKTLSSKEDKDVDTQLQEAAQSNRLPEAYSRYLKLYLKDYQSSLLSAHNQAGPEGKLIIQEAFDSVEVILGTASVKDS